MVYTTTTLAYPKWLYICLKVNMYFYTLYDVILSESSISFSMTTWLVTVTVTILSDVTDMW